PAAAGSPGPLENITPSGARSATCSMVASAASTCTSTPRSASRRAVIAFTPRSTSTTRRRGSPTAGTTYGSAVVTSQVSSAPAIAQMRGEGTGVDAADPDHAVCFEVVGERPPRAPAAGQPGGVTYREARDPDPLRLHVVVSHPGIADVRCRHHHQLAVVGRIGQSLLVAGHHGGEHEFAGGGAAGAHRLTTKQPTVLECQHRRRRRGHRLASTSFRSSTVGFPRRKVVTTSPGSSRPAQGVVRDSDAPLAGSTVSSTAGSYSTRFAGATEARPRP